MVVLFVVVALAGAGIGWSVARARTPGGASTSADGASTPGQLWTCSMHPQVLQHAPGVCPICHMALTPVGADAQSGALAIDPVVIQSMGVRTERVRRRDLHRDVRASGTFVERSPDHRDVNLRVSGWIETLHADIDGMPVKRGDPLFELSSPELTVAVEELIAARKQRASSDSASDSIGATLFAAARARLVQLGLSAERIDALAALDAAPATVTFESPTDGHVTATTVYAGAAVMAGDRVMRIANNHRLWLDARVPARDVSRVENGARVTAEVDAWPGETFEGHVLFLHPHLDDATRTALVRAEIDNSRGKLREGQWASVSIESTTRADALVVSREVLIDTGRRHVAFVSAGGGRFEPRDVTVGLAGDDGLVEVTSGLADGEEVVASGQFLLDSESRLREAVRKFLAPGAAPTATATRPEWADGVDPLVEAYLALSDALGREQVADTPLDASPFVARARDLARRSRDDAAVVAIVRAAEPLTKASLSEQRELFKRVSDAVLDLVERVPPSATLGSTLYVLRCPMAPGRWLQRDPSVKNPYYGTTMKECGEVVKPLTLPSADAKGRDR